MRKMMDNHNMNSPSRPLPHFFNDHHSFTTKKSRSSSTPSSKKVPPRPPSKSVPPVSRIFAHTLNLKPQMISFHEHNDSSLSKCYDESREESYFEQCFQIESKLGSGSFGDVFKVRSKEDSKYYAIKRSRDKYKGRSDRERKLQEVMKFEQLPQHPNCVRFYRAWEEKQRLYIQTELCEISLSEYALRNHDIPEKLVWNFLIDLLHAVRHLHNYQFIHLDIKPDNIFIATDGTCKLGDFGLVFDLKKMDANEATEGDPKYLAKELMQTIFTKSADIFSIGITILELAADLDLPSGGKGWHQLRDGQIPDHLFYNISVELRSIIMMMMHPDYRKRPSADKLLQHSAIVKFKKMRSRELFIKNSLSAFRNLFKRLRLLLVYIFFILSYPFIFSYKSICKKSKLLTPPPSAVSSRHGTSIDWDGHYSDDEVFDISTVSNSFITDSSSSSCETKLSTNDSFNHNYSQTNSPSQFGTSKLLRHRPIYDPLLSPSFKTSSPITKIHYPNEAKSLFKDSINNSRPKLVNQKLNFCDIDNDDDDDDNDNDDGDLDASFHFGPKNLLRTFEEIDNETEDAT